MRASISFLSLLLSLQISAHAQNLSGADAKPDFQQVQCKTAGSDDVGALGLVNENFSSSQTVDTVTLTATSTLYVCTISTDGQKTLAWKVANPYAGFQVQYFDYASNSIQSRKVIIDSSKPYNRMKLMALIDGHHSSTSSSEATMQPTGQNSFTGSVTLQKSDLLNAQDLKKLKQGSTVVKTVELYQVSNLTTYYPNGEELLTGDESRSGRNVLLSFKQQGNQINLVGVAK
jgi:hypothetical protein